MDIERIKAEIEKEYDEAVRLRRHIHSHPELSNEEKDTMEYICAYLDRIGVPYEKNVGGYGVVGLIGSPDAEFSVGIRADIDALPIEEMNDVPYKSQVPGVMHACGHDMHTAVLMGTAVILKNMESELKAAVRLFFQPAEEKGGGARQMIEQGCMEDPPVRRCLGLHVEPDDPAGHLTFLPHQMNASSDGLFITVTGTSTHGSTPDQGVDAIVASAHVITALQNISSRFISPKKPVVVTVGTIQGGTKNNIIAGSVKMTGTIRTLEPSVREKVWSLIRTSAENAAAACGASATVEITPGYPPVINDEYTVMMLKEEAEKLIGAENVSVCDEPEMGGEDFSYFSSAVPSCYFRLGVYRDNGHPQMVHNEWFSPDEQAMKNGILMETVGCLLLIEDELKKA